MQYKALYRENRPEVFSEMLGQEHIVKILRHQIATDTVSHAYLFCGTRGTGKTTTARILAKALNCIGDTEDKPCGTCPHCRAIAESNFIDVIEIDAASNNGVDNIRELRESVKYPPSVGRKKVYIIDEVHMLSTGAFNALLKTLEEPPENVVFILATTNPEKMPQTVLSRCMRLDFKRVSAAEIKENMRRIAQAHGVEITESALALLAANADGSVRDSLSILEQCLSSGETRLDRETVLDFLGVVSEDFYLELTDDVLAADVSGALVLLDQALNEGKDVRQMMKDWMAHYRSLLIAKFVENPEDMLNMSSENIEKLKEQSRRIELPDLNRSIVTLARTINDARYSTQARILMEVAVVTIASGLSYGEEEAPRQAAPVRRPAPRQPAPRREAPAPRQAAPQQAPAQARQVPPPWDADRPVPQPDAPGVQAPAEPPVQQAPPQTPAQGDDLAQIWEDVMEDAIESKPQMSMMRGAHLAAMNEKEFKLVVESDFMKMMLEREADLLCSLMEKRTGTRRKMVCRLDGEKEEESRESELARIAEEASAVLGTTVRIK